MSYLDKRLAVGEQVVHRGAFHLLQWLYAWAALVFLGVIIIGIYIWLKEIIRLSTTEMAVTNRRVVLKQGLLNVRVSELTLPSIEGSDIRQSILGRLFGYGSLTLRGQGDTHVDFPTMAHPSRFRTAAEGARIATDSQPVEVVPVSADRLDPGLQDERARTLGRSRRPNKRQPVH